MDKIDTIKTQWHTFLKGVLVCSLGAYGGPEAHYGVFMDQLVIKKHYLSEEELIELIALTGVLPGPSSTQTIVAVGHKIGGPILAFYTLLVWALPALIVMTSLSFLGNILHALDISQAILRFIGSMAMGFVFTAAYRIARKVIKDKITLCLFIFGAIITYLYQAFYIYPLVLLTGGLIGIIFSYEKNLWNKVKINVRWNYLIIFLAIAIISLLASLSTNEMMIDLFASFYRYGYMVIGGGQVVVPMMYNELVEVNQYLTNQEFLTGFGLVQGLPGPMFSFSAYAGGLAASSYGVFYQIMAGMISGISIFLPGVILIYLVYPLWEQLKNIKGIKVSLNGIVATAGGLILTTGILLLQKTGLTYINIGIIILTIILLLSKKIPTPLIVILMMILGIVL
ncbi:MAG: chromate efflux transporter [Erysipelotrichaceae bacterium]|nr:chromate efflux transporter [Erysipelotrichaceae bacterium]